LGTPSKKTDAGFLSAATNSLPREVTRHQRDYPTEGIEQALAELPMVEGKPFYLH
jgi:hypothetical protein